MQHRHDGVKPNAKSCPDCTDQPVGVFARIPVGGTARAEGCAPVADACGCAAPCEERGRTRVAPQRFGIKHDALAGCRQRPHEAGWILDSTNQHVDGWISGELRNHVRQQPSGVNAVVVRPRNDRSR